MDNVCNICTFGKRKYSLYSTWNTISANWALILLRDIRLDERQIRFTGFMSRRQIYYHIDVKSYKFTFVLQIIKGTDEHISRDLNIK